MLKQTHTHTVQLHTHLHAAFAHETKKQKTKTEQITPLGPSSFYKETRANWQFGTVKLPSRITIIIIIMNLPVFGRRPLRQLLLAQALGRTRAEEKKMRKEAVGGGQPRSASNTSRQIQPQECTCPMAVEVLTKLRGGERGWERSGG